MGAIFAGILIILLIPLFLAMVLLPFLLWPVVESFGYYCILLLISIPLVFIFPDTFNKPGFFTYLLAVPMSIFLVFGWLQFWLMPKGKRFPAIKH